jgi:hypothetical protein
MRYSRPAVRSANIGQLGNAGRPERERRVSDGERRWLTINQVVERLRAAGYDDTGATIRRMVDAGDFGKEGEGWYRTERGKYRMVAPAVVDALIARRRGHSTPS